MFDINKKNKKNCFFSFLLVIQFLVINLSFFSDEIQIKKKNEWDSFIYQHENLQFNFVSENSGTITLSPFMLSVSDQVDFLLNFNYENEDNMIYYDQTQNYKIDFIKGILSKNMAKIGNAFNFINEDDKIVLYPLASALFKQDNEIRSFTIQFWLYPTTLTDNEIIIQIGSPFYDAHSDQIIEQEIACIIQKQKIVWEFKNIFYNSSGQYISFIVEPVKQVFPLKWSHHAISYSQNDGRIIQYINGQKESIVYTTENGDENSTHLLMRIEKKNPISIIIGENYHGYMDEISIHNRSLNDFDLSIYQQEFGTLQSHVLKIGEGRIQIKNIRADFNADNHSAVQFFYRLSDIPFIESAVPQNSNELNLKTANTGINGKENNIFLHENSFKNTPLWTEFRAGQLPDQFDEVYGNYLQIKCIFFPGINNLYSPQLSQLSIEYIPDEIPKAPAGLVISMQGNKVYLKWQKNTEDDIQGYLVYYGLKSQSYFGKGSSLGDSPCDVGNTNEVLMGNLENNRLYYFAVTAYDKGGKTHQSHFSKEMIVRPRYVE